MRTRNIIYITLAAASLTFWGCDDILDKKSLDTASEREVFADESLTRSFVNGTYRDIRFPFDDENSFTDGLTDNAYNQHGSAESTIKVYTRGEVSQDNGEGITRSLWDRMYTAIRKTNLFFEQTANSATIEEAPLMQMTGEMRFLRAYFYAELLRWYGKVPLITQTYDIDEASYGIEQSTPSEIGAFIASECDKAAQELLSMTEAGYQSGRASAEAALALKARVLLFTASELVNPSHDLAKWSAAAAANKAVMDLPNLSLAQGADAYGAIFQGTNTQEVIFARYFSNAVTQGWGVNTWLFPNSEGGWSTTTPTQDLIDDYEMTNGLLPSEPGSGYSAANPYVDRDPRFYESILFNGAPFRGATYDPWLDKSNPVSSDLAGKDSRISKTSPHNASKTGYTFRKWALENQNWDAGNTGPYIIFRLTEFYLNYAEAQIELGDEGEAKRVLNILRGRYNMPDITESDDALVARYRRERRVEMLLEEQHFFDIRRWKVGSETLDKAAMGVDVYKDGATFEYHFDLTADNTRNWNDRMYWLPIPSTEIQKSREVLKQNDGYVQ